MNHLEVPRISVVVSTYQRAPLLRRALASLKAQTIRDFEVVVVDDGSTDETQALLASWDDPRVRAIRQENRGRSAARNRGAKEARAKIVTFLDSDDEAKPGWLDALVGGFDAPDVGVVCCGLEVRQSGNPGGSESRVRLPRNLGPVYGNVTGLFLTGTAAIRRPLFLDVGGYEASLSHGENTDLAHRLLGRCRRDKLRIVSVPSALMLFHHERSGLDMAGCRARLEAARTIVERHGARYREHAPTSFARYCAIIGVNSVRLGRMPEARRWFAQALRTSPAEVVHWGRLLISVFPPVARRVWLLPRNPE